MSVPSVTIEDSHGLRRERITRTALSGFVAKAAMFLPTIAITKIALPALGPERFGVLMTILSLMTFLGLADLGVGSSLVTAISRAVGSGNDVEIRRLQANGLVAVSIVALALFLASVALHYSTLGSIVFPLSAGAVQREATGGLAAFGACFALTLPLSLIGKIQLGLQQGHVPNYWQVAAAIINFCAASMAACTQMSITWIVAGMLSGTLLCSAANMAAYYWRKPELRPAFSDVSFREIRSLLADALHYLLLQIIFLIAYAADTLIVARFLGAQYASVYAISERLFSIVGVAVTVITAPLWAAYGEALGAKDLEWVRRTLRVSTRRIGLAALGTSGLILATLQPIVQVLSSNRLEVPVSLAIMMACWRVVEAIGHSLSVYMYARQAIRFVLITGGATAVISLVAKVAIVPRAELFAIPAIMGICYVLLCLIPTGFFLRRVLSVKTSCSQFSAVG